VVAMTATCLRVSTVDSPRTSYTIVVTASNGSVHYSINVTVSVVDFYITASPTLVNVAIGGFTSMIVQGVPVNGYANTVSLRVYGLPLCLISLNANKTILHVNEPFIPSSSVFTIKALSGCSASTTIIVVIAYDTSYGVTRTTSFVLTVSDFKLSSNPTVLGIKSDESKSVNITATSVNGYPTTSIALAVQGLPLCASYSFGPPTPLMLMQGLSNTTSLTITTGPLCPSEAFN